MTKNDLAWDRFFSRTGSLAEISENGFVYINAVDMKSLGEREPRLMAKHDTIAVTPKIFRDNNLSLFPVRNGVYVVFKDHTHRTYYDIPPQIYSAQPIAHNSSVDLASFDAYPGDQRLNESQAIDFGYISRLLHQFTGESTLNLAIRGRSYSGEFSFRLPDVEHCAEVSSVQIEIDAGYESENSIYLIEAKVGRRSDFHIRQLYYPYLEWSRRSNKRIVPIFLAFTNGKYYLTEFAFSDAFGAISATRAKCYQLSYARPTQVDLQRVLNSIQEAVEPNIPYPQANDLDKVIDLVNAVSSGTRDNTSLADLFEFDERQGDYYANAAIYLNLAYRESHVFQLTDTGKRFLSFKNASDRNRLLVQQMVSRPTLRRILYLLIGRDYQLEQISNAEIAEVIERYTVLTGSTPSRRASTIRQWLKWLIDNNALAVQ